MDSDSLHSSYGGSSSNAYGSTDEEIEYRERYWSWEDLPYLLPEHMSPEERLQVLQVSGSKKLPRTVDTIHVRDCNLSLAEWEALLMPLKSSPVLEKVRIWSGHEFPPGMREIIYGHFREVLAHVSNLKELSFYAESRWNSYSESPSEPDTGVSFVEQLALGLGSNPNPTLEKLFIGFSKFPRDDTVHHVVELIRCTVKLQQLTLDHVHKLEELEVEELSNALKQCKSLRTLVINGAEEGMVEVLIRAFAGDRSRENQTLSNLSLTQNIVGLGSALHHLLAANIPEVLMVVSDSEWAFDHKLYLVDFQWIEIGNRLLQESALTMFTIQMISNNHTFPEWANKQSAAWLSGLQQVWETSQHSKRLHISLEYGDDVNGASHQDMGVLLKTLSLGGLRKVDLSFHPVRSFSSTTPEPLGINYTLETLNKNQCVETLTLGFFEGDDDSLRDEVRAARNMLLDGLRYNTSVTCLKLKPSFFQFLSEDVFKRLLKLLRLNFYLREVKVDCREWLHDGKAAILSEAINRNTRQADYISVIQKAGLKFGSAKAGRILLCGSPQAGKTRLRKTMLRLTDSIPKWMDIRTGRLVTSIKSSLDLDLKKTKGIEIATLQDEKLNLTVWDLAGQSIYRPLQEVLFPKSGQACIFVFIFNPFETGKDRKVWKKNVESAFQTDLRSWLKFIASNTQDKAVSRTQVLVVLSHRDKMARSETDLNWARNIVDQFQSTFEGKVELFSGKEIQCINCYDGGEVNLVMESIFQRIKSDFREINGRHLVPLPGIELTAVLLKRPKEILTSPIWRTSKLYCFFIKHNDALRHIGPESESGRTVLQAMASYLHDVGTIIIVPNSDLVVVDPNWMTEKFLGELINQGHGFQAVGSPKRQYHCDEDGFVGERTLTNMLSALVDQFHQERIQVSLDELRELLLNLNLCFKLDDKDGDSRYFMPAIIDDYNDKKNFQKKRLRWSIESSDGCQDFGFRLQCNDLERTCLSRSFFPRFQIKLRNLLVQELKTSDKNICCSRGLIEIHEDGHDIFVESDSLAEEHIDILVRTCDTGNHKSSNTTRLSVNKIRKRAVKFVTVNIITPLREFSTSDMGCAGVALSLCILRTQCVTHLIPLELRGPEQAVSVEDLSNKLLDNAKKQLGYTRAFDITTDNYIDNCMTYKHSWPAIGDPKYDPEGTADPLYPLSLPRDAESATDLLSPKIVEDIKKELKKIYLHTGLEIRPPTSTHIRTAPEEVIKLNDEVYEIHAPLDRDPSVELVFVHGISQNENDDKPYLTTWSTMPSDAGGEKCWVNTWLVNEEIEEIDIQMRYARILTVSYDSSVSKTQSKGTLDSYCIAENLTNSLINLANVGQHNCPIVLVGHCVGGLVIKEVCLHASRSVGGHGNNKSMYEAFMQNLKGFFFYATPHMGFSAKLESLHLTGDLVESVNFWNKRTARVNQEFQQTREMHKWKAHGVGESNKTDFTVFKKAWPIRITAMMVEEPSARSACMEKFSSVQHTDHFTICRPSDNASNSYLNFVSFLRELFAPPQENVE
ncbi:hypothetical protein Mapa_005968 [Marchantia paleacea]|nr:hypothetical protein Mapa_005968 [Marchantia paleacea]